MAMNSTMLAKLREAKAKYANRGDSKIVKLQEGKTTIRIIAANIGSRTDLDPSQFWRDVGVHWIKEDENAKPVAVVGCHEVVFGEACSICNAIEQSGKSQTDDETLGLIKSWKPNKQVLVQAIIRSGAGASEMPQILGLTPGTFSDVCGILETYTDDDTDPLDPQTGIDLIIERKGKGKNDTKYSVFPAPKSKPVSKEALAAVIDLDEYIQKEHFRGEEPKALRAIGSITGANVTNLLPARGKTLLTSKAASVAEEDDSGTPTPPPPVRKTSVAAALKAKAPEPIDLDDAEVDDVLSQLDEL